MQKIWNGSQVSNKGDCFAIYQVKHTDELRDIRYEGLEWLQSIGRTVQRDNYELVYTASLLPSDLKDDTTEQLFYRFNNEIGRASCRERV